MWDLVPCLGTEPMPPALETRDLDHRNPREVPLLYFLSLDFIQVQHAYKKITQTLSVQLDELLQNSFISEALFCPSVLTANTMMSSVCS